MFKAASTLTETNHAVTKIHPLVSLELSQSAFNSSLVAPKVSNVVVVIRTKLDNPDDDLEVRALSPARPHPIFHMLSGDYPACCSCPEARSSCLCPCCQRTPMSPGFPHLAALLRKIPPHFPLPPSVSNQHCRPSTAIEDFLLRTAECHISRTSHLPPNSGNSWLLTQD